MIAAFYGRPAVRADGSYGDDPPLARLDVPAVGGEQPEVVAYAGRHFVRLTATRYQEASAVVIGPARPAPDAPAGGAGSRPRVVCLCGSTRFPAAFETANRSETMAGRVVLSVGIFGHAEGIDMGGPVKAMLDALHLRKIDLADEVLVLNVGGYVGESTGREIAYARSLGKPVRFLEGAS